MDRSGEDVVFGCEIRGVLAKEIWPLVSYALD